MFFLNTFSEAPSCPPLVLAPSPSRAVCSPWKVSSRWPLLPNRPPRLPKPPPPPRPPPPLLPRLPPRRRLLRLRPTLQETTLGQPGVSCRPHPWVRASRRHPRRRRRVRFPRKRGRRSLRQCRSLCLRPGFRSNQVFQRSTRLRLRRRQCRRVRRPRKRGRPKRRRRRRQPHLAQDTSLQRVQRPRRRGCLYQQGCSSIAITMLR